MTRIPTLQTIVTVQWECNKRPGVERQCDVAVEFTFDGVDDFEVLAAEIVGEDSEAEPCGIDDHTFDLLIDEATIERAAEVYGDWLSGQDGSDDY
jgi:hypothetical protein